MKLQPLADRIVIKKIEAETKSASGILLPDSAKEQPLAGKVIALAENIDDIKVGDTILYSRYTRDNRMYNPDVIAYEGDELTILTKENVIAVAKGGK